MAGTAEFKLLPTDFKNVTVNGYIRKIKLKNESYIAIESKTNNVMVKNDNNNSIVGNDEFIPNNVNRDELVARLDEKIVAILPDYPKVESIKNRAIKIKTGWKENCLINAELLMKKNTEAVEEEQIVGTIPEDNIETTPVETSEGVIEEDLNNIPTEEPGETSEGVDTPIENEEMAEHQNEEIPAAIEDTVVDDSQELISKNSERSININVEEEETKPIINVQNFKMPTLPKLELKLLNKEINEANNEIVSSDFKLDSEMELDISEKLDDNKDSIEASDISDIKNAIESTEIEDIKAALESIKQKKAEQERANQAKQEAEEARKEEEAKLEEIKRRNLEAVEKIKVQREAISEEIEENMKREEEERQRAEEIRKQIELQEKLFGELESEILDI